MAGIAIIVKDMSFAENNIGHVTIVSEPVPVTGISINGNTSVPINASTISLSVAYTPSDTTQTGVTWSVVSGNTYASVNQNGVVTLSNLEVNAKFKIRATSTQKSTVYGEKEFTVVSSNLITAIKNGKKVNTANGQFVDDSNYICTDWINVNNVSIAAFTLVSSVAISGQYGGSLNAYNCKIGIYWEDASGNFHDTLITNQFISNETYGNIIAPLNIPVRLMKRVSLYSLVAEPKGAAAALAILRCNLSDWQSATLMVKNMLSSGTETYDSDICHSRVYSAITDLTWIFVRYTSTNLSQWMLTIKQGESVSIKAQGANNGRAWVKYTIGGETIESAEANADYRTNAYTFTADQDMFLGGTEQNDDLANFEVNITKPQ